MRFPSENTWKTYFLQNHILFLEKPRFSLQFCWKSRRTNVSFALLVKAIADSARGWRAVCIPKAQGEVGRNFSFSLTWHEPALIWKPNGWEFPNSLSFKPSAPIFPLCVAKEEALIADTQHGWSTEAQILQTEDWIILRIQSKGIWCRPRDLGLISWSWSGSVYVILHVWQSSHWSLLCWWGHEWAETEETLNVQESFRSILITTLCFKNVTMIYSSNLCCRFVVRVLHRQCDTANGSLIIADYFKKVVL